MQKITNCLFARFECSIWVWIAFLDVMGSPSTIIVCPLFRAFLMMDISCSGSCIRFLYSSLEPTANRCTWKHFKNQATVFSLLFTRSPPSHPPPPPPRIVSGKKITTPCGELNQWLSIWRFGTKRRIEHFEMGVVKKPLFTFKLGSLYLETSHTGRKNMTHFHDGSLYKI